jgi:glycosyltransferase involved in cell wall biosynthesis
MNNTISILILHSRLSDYFLNVFYEFKKRNLDIDIHIVYKSPDKNQAPFKFDFDRYDFSFYDEKDYNASSLASLTQTIKPKIIICNSWSFKKYLKTVKLFRNDCKTIMNMDNQFHGTFKQYLGIFYGHFYLSKLFDKVWVPGLPQKKFALKLGFKSDSILTGWYVANESIFKKKQVDLKFKKRFVFVGRYVKVKGIEDLCKSFIKLQNNCPNDWELHCIGSGPLKDKIQEHPKIMHHGFLQPSEMNKILNEGGVFVLPSEFEPWGVVVHEYAMAGFPLICSSNVGAATEFINSKNGHIFNLKKDKSGLYKCLKSFTEKSSEELQEMSLESLKLSKNVTVDDWVLKLKNEL